MAELAGKPVVGIAFIMEGVTEKVFYKAYARHAAAQLGLSCEELIVSDTSAFVVGGPRGSALLLFHSVGSVTQIPNAGSWFARVCVGGWPSAPWHALLCYDTDAYNADVTKFHEGDWLQLRREIGRDASSVVDLAAEADIEDVMLCDSEGVLSFLGLPAETPIPGGRKGKRKMAKLYRMVAPNVAYHAGDKARSLVEALDMQLIARNAPEGVDLLRIDKLLATLLGAGADDGLDVQSGGDQANRSLQESED
ncbi:MULTISPECIES: hypothetical protein [unclassified Adlercreutzia]|uniref:hypothetical protein n=1 Tax=unclassified Adlercreutzia TaxID=2636013 RepID=UPI0013EDA6CD|nr:MULTISPECIES: hypothetical protein [unclassified Adlercreutzia]